MRCSIAARRAPASPSADGERVRAGARDGLRQRDLRRGHAGDAARQRRHRPHALFHGRREQAVERAADPDRLRARPGRHLPQRQHRQRQRNPRPAGPRRIDLPDQQRHRSGAAPLCALAGRIDRRRAGRGDHAADRRVLVRAHHEGPPDRRARSARLPAAGARPARRRLGGVLGDLRARSDRRHLRARRRARRGADHRRRTALRSIKPFPKAPLSHCIFEHVYFARPDSEVFGAERQRSAHQSRPRAGARDRHRRRRGRADSRLGRLRGDRLFGRGEDSAALRADPQSLRRPHVHRAGAVDPALRREGEAQSRARASSPASASC